MYSLSKDCFFSNCKKQTSNHFGIWSIKRYKDCDWMACSGGRCPVLCYDATDDKNIQLIIEILEGNNAFDFNYQATEQDILNLILNEQKEYEFEYMGGKWRACDSSSRHLNAHLILVQGILKECNDLNETVVL